LATAGQFTLAADDGVLGSVPFCAALGGNVRILGEGFGLETVRIGLGDGCGGMSGLRKKSSQTILKTNVRNDASKQMSEMIAKTKVRNDASKKTPP